MSAASAVRRLSTELAVQPHPRVTLSLAIGTIADYTAGVTTVLIGVDQLIMCRCASYTPNAGDTVLVLLNGSSPIVLDRIVDIPELGD